MKLTGQKFQRVTRHALFKDSMDTVFLSETWAKTYEGELWEIDNRDQHLDDD